MVDQTAIAELDRFHQVPLVKELEPSLLELEGVEHQRSSAVMNRRWG